MKKYPSFFIVGAPKAGTTSLYDYLSECGDIFLPQEKEIHYFGSDLLTKQRKGNSISEKTYLSHFEAMGEEKVAGEASVLYLKSTKAAMEIYEFCPEARIIIMLRQPSHLIYSLHSQLLSQGDEDVIDFSKALELEEARKAGKNLPIGVSVPDDGIFYRDVGKLGTQVERFMNVFPTNQIKFIFFEDFVENTAAEVSSVLKFLGLPNYTNPKISKVSNPNSRARSKALTRLLYHPPNWAVWVAKKIAPRQSLITIRRELRKFNNVRSKREELPSELYKELTSYFDSEIIKLEKLTGRDLTLWRSHTNL
ncbi:sulfotransferase family protein [Sulfitobacter pontiacus]|uniref:sulfotransferase family protein n=1 Tax=Sulfitobacter pontiacus TaxID=60137 RepID=UPI0021A26427|nr:sulfotransferase [Sulfitobacter pontiacus]UWR20820.1 sulfotransferase [Sulfitobacter pontiacus]